jgi:hypothetical protein
LVEGGVSASSITFSSVVAAALTPCWSLAVAWPNALRLAARYPVRKTGGARRKAFYSYAAVAPDITVNVTLKCQDVMNLLPDQIDLELSAPGREEEVETWREVFGIEEGYKAKLCAKNDGRAWPVEIVRVGRERSNDEGSALGSGAQGGRPISV